MKKKIDLFEIINDFILCIIGFICIYPFLYEIFVAVSDGRFLAAGQVTFLPKGLNLEVFKYVLSNPKLDIAVGMRNSFMYTAGGTLAGVLTTYITAYALSRPQIKSRYLLMGIFTMTWVFEAGIIPTYIVYSQFGFIDNPLVMIVPGAINTQYLIICKPIWKGCHMNWRKRLLLTGPISSGSCGMCICLFPNPLWQQSEPFTQLIYGISILFPRYI